MGQMGSAPFASTRRRRRDGGAFSPLALYANGEAGGWYDPSDLTPEKVSWRRNLLTYSEQFDNSAWTKSNASILSNLLTWSQDFDNAAWNLFNATVTANTTVAPDGTTTADTVTTNTNPASNGIWQSVTVTASTQYTFSFYARRGTATDLKYSVYNNTGGADIVAATSYYSSTSSTDWSRITLTFTTPVGCTSIRVYPVRDAGSLGTMFIWGAQLVPGTTAQTYTPTTSAAAPIPFTAPDGSATADLLFHTSSTAATYLTQQIGQSQATWTISTYAKASGKSVVFLYLQSASTRGIAYFDLSDGTTQVVAGSSSTLTVTMTAVGSGWYRCTATSTAAFDLSASVGNGVGVCDAKGSTTFTASGANGILLWGAQLEAAYTASSYQRITDVTSDFLAAFPQHALYQDSAGTTPVMALGQPVGLVLDKSKGGLANLGSELVTNGTFDTNVTGWTAQSGDTLAWDAGNGGRLKITDTNSAGAGIAYQTINTVAGVGYFVQYASSLGNAQQTRIYVGTSVGNSSMGVAVNNADTTFGTLFFTASGTTAVLQFVCQSTGAFAYLDNISVRAVPGAHAIQATSASRPTCDARVNRLTYSEQFDNAFWSDKNNVTITANAAVAPDGTTTADKLIPNTTNGYHNLGSSFIGDVATTVRISLYAKAAGLNLIRISGGNPGTNFVQADLSTGAFTSANVTDASVTSVGNGWWLLSCVLPATGGSNGFFYAVCPNQTNGTYTLWAGNGTDGVFIWGADSRFSSDASLPYQRVVTASDYADVQAPRYLTCDGVDDSLYTAASVDFATWTSGTRRNLLTYPSAFDNAVWVKTNVTVTANTVVAPDGTTTADRLVETAVTSAHETRNAELTVGAGTYTFSTYVQAGERTACALYFYGTATGSVDKYGVFNLSNGTVAETASGVTASIESAGVPNWYRASVTLTVISGTLRSYIALMNGTAWASNISYAGNTANGLYVWGAQLELGSTATAFQDVGTDKMTVVTGVRKLSDAASTTLLELSATAGSNNGSFAIYAPGSTASPDFYWRSRGTATSNAASNAFAAPVTAVLTALGSISEDIAVLRGNGVQVASSVTDQGAGTYGTYVFFIGRQNNTSFPYNGRIYQLIVRGAQTDTATVQQTERFVAGKTGLVI